MKLLAKAWGSEYIVMAAAGIAAGCSIAILVINHQTTPDFWYVGSLAMQAVFCVLGFRVVSLANKKSFAELIEKVAKEMPLWLPMMKVWFGCVLLSIICGVIGLMSKNSSIAAAGLALAVLIFALAMVLILTRYLWKRITKKRIPSSPSAIESQNAE